MKRLLAGLVIATVSLSAAPRAVAEERNQTNSGLFSPSRLEPLIREAIEKEARPKAQDATARAPKRDSILNGGLIGAAIGVGVVPPLRIAATGGSDDIGAAWLKLSPLPAIGGFAVGVIIDALR
jgi:hypothetical protein